MPLPMVHLSVARRLVEQYGYPSSPAFYLGSIAPDAIHKRAGTGRRDKLDVHLIGEEGLDGGRLRDLLAGDREKGGDGALALGYAAHVLTDICWREDLLLPFRAQQEERLRRDVSSRNEMSVDELRTLYYDECDKVDLDLYDGQPWRPEVWALLRTAPARDLDGLLSAVEIAGWRDRVLAWFDDNRHKADYLPRYLTLDRVLSFIDQAAAKVYRQLERSYE